MLLFWKEFKKIKEKEKLFYDKCDLYEWEFLKREKNVLFIIYVYMYFDWFLLKKKKIENGDYMKVYI